MIRPVDHDDRDAVWALLEPVIREGATYAFDRDMTRDDALAFWIDNAEKSFVAEKDGRVVGTYYVRRNQAGGGGHVANCGYVVSTEARGSGIARSMCEHSMGVAREVGFTAMQYNFVVSTNVGAIALWKSLGFDEVGRLPDAFIHPDTGAVDALVMFRTL